MSNRNQPKILEITDNGGNHFIMDSEQVVSNPFEEKQNEALNIMGKRASVTEKLTSAKNNLCENHFSIRRGKLEREVNIKMKQLHDNSSRLRYEVKLFDIHKRKNELVTKKRVEPERDFTYDATQINNSEKRLGVMSDCYYLEKKQGYKLRDKAKKDLDTPMAKKAQEFLRQQKMEEKLKEGRSTPKLSNNHVPLWKRRGSKSAPAGSKHGSTRFENKENFDDKLPTIHIGKRKESHVKFSLNEGIKNNMRTPTPELLSRSLTFFSGMRRRSVWHNGSDDEDDDDEYIDTGKLRTLLYGDQFSECPGTISPSLRTSTRESARSMSIIRRNQNRPITQEMMQQERKRINNKIKRFFDKIEIESIGSLSDDEEDTTVNQPPPPKVGIQNQASKMMNVFSKPVENTNAFQATVIKPKESEDKKSASTNRSKSVQSNHSLKAGKQKKNLWEYIQVQLDKGNLKRALTPSELILQQMTGLDLMDSKEKHIPLHAANRALRHTPTFKMRKVVQNLNAKSHEI
ncbi:hypothetical protein KUTeg_019337 [Tegillarca granosa]|uniref:Uncharacterized protein n=1 Tax=Tegillarca granosa TaxID=220873 RepID=A0ABQ9EET4_TEGGR|nr:hypothetical protein KUTeg_019337 [Tegillarca granosa]